MVDFYCGWCTGSRLNHWLFSIWLNYPAWPDNHYCTSIWICSRCWSLAIICWGACRLGWLGWLIRLSRISLRTLIANVRECRLMWRRVRYFCRWWLRRFCFVCRSQRWIDRLGSKFHGFVLYGIGWGRRFLRMNSRGDDFLWITQLRRTKISLPGLNLATGPESSLKN